MMAQIPAANPTAMHETLIAIIGIIAALNLFLTFYKTHIRLDTSNLVSKTEFTGRISEQKTDIIKLENQIRANETEVRASFESLKSQVARLTAITDHQNHSLDQIDEKLTQLLQRKS